MNPYQPPLTDAEESPQDLQVTEGASCPPCRACGSANTTNGEIFRSKPNLLGILLLGWLFVLIRTAFTVRKEECLDCGHLHRYRPDRSKIAMGVLVVIGILIALAALA